MVKDKELKQTLSRITNGSTIGCHKDRHGFNTLIIQFGCNACSWRDTPMCPHGFTGLETHNKRICSQRAIYVQEVFKIAGNQTKFFQIEELTRLKLLIDKITSEISTEGDLNSNLGKMLPTLSKNLISLTDKMRRQDEGIKLQGEMTVIHEDLRKVVDIEAKKIEEQDNNTRQGEFTEEIRDSREQAS